MPRFFDENLRTNLLMACFSGCKLNFLLAIPSTAVPRCTSSNPPVNDVDDANNTIDLDRRRGFENGEVGCTMLLALGTVYGDDGCMKAEEVWNSNAKQINISCVLVR